MFRTVLVSLTVALLAAGCPNDPVAVCDPACLPTIQLCCPQGDGAARCVNTLTDPMNCGDCGNACAAGMVCERGSCITRITDAGPRDAPFVRADVPTGCMGSYMCGDVSIPCRGFSGGANEDGRSDPSFMNCPTCGRACDPMSASRCATPGGGVGTPECLCGVYRCLGMEQCVRGMDGTYECIDTDTDEQNCGMIGRACAMGETCTGGMCGCGATGAPCAMGQSCCGGACIPTEADDLNCGGCGTRCGAGETCAGSRCTCGGDVCERMTMGSLGELCCGGACVPQDVDNCGTCGARCDTADEEVCFNNMNPLFGRVCCGPMPVLPIFGICTGGLPFDAGVDAGADAGDLDASALDAGTDSDAGVDAGIDAPP